MPCLSGVRRMPRLPRVRGGLAYGPKYLADDAPVDPAGGDVGAGTQPRVIAPFTGGDRRDAAP